MSLYQYIFSNCTVTLAHRFYFIIAKYVRLIYSSLF